MLNCHKFIIQNPRRWGQREHCQSYQIGRYQSRGKMEPFPFCLSLSQLLIQIYEYNLTLSEFPMLLEKVLTPIEMRTILQQNQNNLKLFIARYGEKVAIEHVDLHMVENLKKNYQMFISVLHEQGNSQINNYSLHFIATISSGCLKLNRIDQAKEILKKCQAYLQGTHIDPLLMVACLNNLANIQKLKNKHYKSLRISLKALEVMANHMEKLRQKKDKERLRQDAVVFLIVIIRCKLTLSIILAKNEEKYFLKAYELMNYLGYQNCLRFLGKDSIFIKRFTPVQKEFHLPIFKTEQKIQKKPQNQNQKLILEQLGKIHEVLKSKKNPDIVVYAGQPNNSGSKVVLNQSQVSIIITQPQEKELPKIPKPSIKQTPKKEEPTPQIVIEDPSISIEQKLEQIQQLQAESIKKQASIDQRSPTPEYIPSESESESEQPEQPAIVQQTIFIDKWELKIRYQRQKGQPLGRLTIQSFRTSVNKKKRQSRMEQLQGEKLQKIMAQINFEDIYPYELYSEQMDEEQFVQYNIKPFLDVDKEGQVIIYPKSKGLFQPLLMKVFNQDSLIFFNHVRNNLYRLSISQLYSFKSIYLNIELCPESMMYYFTFEEEVNDFITAIFKSIEKDKNVDVPNSIKDKNKTCQLLKKEELIQYLKEIIAQFQNIIVHREEETAVNQILENQLLYYKYIEISKEKKGMYYVVRYLPSISCFDVYLKNNYLTYAIDQQTKAEGNALYTPRDFLRDFGVSMKCSYSKKKLFAYLQIIAKKYTLTTFQSPLTKNDQDAYTKNALLEFPIVESCFKTKMYTRENYCKPINISLLTINNEFPVGIKITEYQPNECRNTGFFIHLVPQEWARPLRRPSPWVNKNLFKTFLNQFDFRRQYFIAQWLQKKGFDLLYFKLMDPSHSLYLYNNINRFIRSKSLVQIFNESKAS